MTNLILIIPFLVVLILLIFYHRRIVWWEYLIILVPAVLLNVIIVGAMKTSNCYDTEYRGDHIIEAHYYEEWDEWITDIQTTFDDDGNVITVDNSHSKTHLAEWKMITSTNDRYIISEEDYNRIVEMWGMSPFFVNMKRSYHTKDGNMYCVLWNKNPLNTITVTTENFYYNYVKGSTSIFKKEKITDEEAIELGLYDYPKIDRQRYPFPQYSWRKHYQPSVLGWHDDQFLKQIDYINGVYGPSHFIRTYILFFKDKPFEIAEKQQAYWANGNFNEHIICLGINSETMNFDWVKTFSWEENPDLSTRTAQWFMVNNNIKALPDFPIWYEQAIVSGKWICREAKDFKYLKTELSNQQLLWLFIISFVYCIGIGIWAILNNFIYKKRK